VAESVKVTDPVYREASDIAEERDVSVKEAIAIMCREGEYNV
jgi:hypothetical protein